MNTIGDIKIGRVNQSMPNYISIRCDRKTVLGNPFYMANETQRTEVCNKFEAYLSQAYATDPAVKQEIQHIAQYVELGQHVLLQCWCAPKRCHCDSIKSFVLNLINKPDYSGYSFKELIMNYLIALLIIAVIVVFALCMYSKYQTNKNTFQYPMFKLDADELALIKLIEYEYPALPSGTMSVYLCDHVYMRKYLIGDDEAWILRDKINQSLGDCAYLTRYINNREIMSKLPNDFSFENKCNLRREWLRRLIAFNTK